MEFVLGAIVFCLGMLCGMGLLAQTQSNNQKEDDGV